MKKPIDSYLKYILILAFLVISGMIVKSQTSMPEILIKNNLNEQTNYIKERTKIYENYRAIREDMFQKLMGNIADTLSAAKSKIYGLNNVTTSLNRTLDSLNASLETTKIKLEDITRTKNSLRVFGLEVNKFLYNSIMWSILSGLAAIIVIGFLVLKRNRSVTIKTREELKELKDEFEVYRKNSREAREKMSMDHFNELKKLKGK